MTSTQVVFIQSWNYSLLSDQTYYLHLYYFWMTWRALTRYKSTFLCIVIISIQYCQAQTSLLLDHLCHVYGSSLTWWTCVPILFPLFTGSCLRCLGCVLIFSCLSLGYFLCRRVTFVICHDWKSCWLFFCFQNFFLFGKYFVLSVYYDETIHTWRLWWLPSSVVCGILFKDINSCSVIWSPSMNSASRPHFHVPCPACVLFWLSRSDTATLFVNVFTVLTIVNIDAEQPSVEQAKLVLHTSCTNDWLRPVRPCLSHSACWCLNVPLGSNLSRMSCNLCALVMWSISEPLHMWVCSASSASESPSTSPASPSPIPPPSTSPATGWFVKFT